MEVGLIKVCLDRTHSKVTIANYLSYSFPTENDLKQGDEIGRAHV